MQTNSKQLSIVPLWFLNLLSFGLLITLSMSLIQFYASDFFKRRQEAAVLHAYSRLTAQELLQNPFANLYMEGKSFIVYDTVNEKIVYGKDEELQLPLASLTKLMTVLVATELLPEFTTISIPSIEDVVDPQLAVGDRWALKDLAAYTLITSSNLGAEAIARAASSFLEGNGTSNEPRLGTDKFVAAMNRTAEKLGLFQTYFLNSSGLDTNLTLGGAYGSARDMATLFSYILQNHPTLLFSTTKSEHVFSSLGNKKAVGRNTNRIVDTIPSLLGSKTGLTDLAGGNLLIAFDASFGQPFVIGVLGSSEEGRFADMQSLISATIEYLGSASRKLESNTGYGVIASVQSPDL